MARIIEGPIAVESVGEGGELKGMRVFGWIVNAQILVGYLLY